MKMYRTGGRVAILKDVIRQRRKQLARLIATLRKALADHAAAVEEGRGSATEFVRRHAEAAKPHFEPDMIEAALRHAGRAIDETE